MKPTSRRLAGLLCLLAVLITACETRPPRPGLAPAEEVASIKTAELAEQAREYVVAAREYDALARQAATPQRELYALKAVEMLIKAGQVREARDKLQPIDVSKLDPSYTARRRMLEAQLAVLEEKPDEAQKLLAQAEKIPNLNPSLSAEILRVRAQVEVALGRPMNAVKALVARERFMVAADDITRNQQELWQLLDTLSRTQMQQERTATRDPVLAGWLELAIINLENAGSRARLANAVEAWKLAHATHPATPAFLKALAKPDVGRVGRIERIALLLPLTSDYAQAAAAVRDGFLAMRAADPNPDKPAVTVVDIGALPAQAPELYKAAVAQGAQMIVGPLGLEAVDLVVKNTDLKTPTLLLSHTSEELDTAGRPVFQFGLPPEQEAAQAAERAWLDGHRQAAVLYPATAWGRRLQAAFTTAWQRLGGIVVASQDYLPDQSDYSDPVKRVLNVAQSEERKDRLETVTKMKLRFEARPREDIDFVFLAADAKHARLIKPQLSYHRASKVPVYATSHVFTGRGNPGLDVDLDGIQFGDMPWMLVGEGRVAELRKKLQVNWPYAHTGLDRLYALGVDTYAVIAHLDRLGSENAVRFGGVTSGITLGRGGHLHRQLLWAQFRQGVPALLDTSVRLKGQFEADGAPAP
jgi:hypothetical protein